MDITEAISRIIKKHRVNQHLTQEELANLSNLDRTYISLIERCQRKPTLEVIFKICAGLKLKPSEFVKEIESIL